MLQYFFVCMLCSIYKYNIIHLYTHTTYIFLNCILYVLYIYEQRKLYIVIPRIYTIFSVRSKNIFFLNSIRESNNSTKKSLFD